MSMRRGRAKRARRRREKRAQVAARFARLVAMVREWGRRDAATEQERQRQKLMRFAQAYGNNAPIRLLGDVQLYPHHARKP